MAARVRGRHHTLRHDSAERGRREGSGAGLEPFAPPQGRGQPSIIRSAASSRRDDGAGRRTRGNQTRPRARRDQGSDWRSFSVDSDGQKAAFPELIYAVGLHVYDVSGRDQLPRPRAHYGWPRGIAITPRCAGKAGCGEKLHPHARRFTRQYCLCQPLGRHLDLSVVAMRDSVIIATRINGRKRTGTGLAALRIFIPLRFSPPTRQ